MGKKEYTKTEQMILDYLQLNKEKSFCAADIHSYILQNGKEINLATVYRNLDKLTDKKRLIKYKSSGSDSVLYQSAGEDGKCQKHLHLQCALCGKIYHLEGEIMNMLAEHIGKEYGFYLECGTSSLNGLCKDCKKNKENKESKESKENKENKENKEREV